ncbi:integrase core domain-containing protein [Streptomyces sp. NPDC002838]|uniref:integrase core domain-containing protein n=1 Tax=Streptomyces sp. NPDC002838 TaxID=3154436 RepID=UPI00331E0FED
MRRPVESGQYVSIRYADRLAEIGAAASVGSAVDSHDNAMAEALNGTFEAELVEMQGTWNDLDQVERAIFQWVTWYNEERLHSALDHAPPAEPERDWWRQQEAPEVRLKQDQRTLRDSGRLGSEHRCAELRGRAMSAVNLAWVAQADTELAHVVVPRSVVWRCRGRLGPGWRPGLGRFGTMASTTQMRTGPAPRRVGASCRS